MKVYNRVNKEYMEISNDYDKVIRICKKVDKCRDCVYYIDEECKACINDKHNVFYPFELDIE